MDAEVKAGMRGACFGTIAAIRFSGSATAEQLKKIGDYILALEHDNQRITKGLQVIAERGADRPSGKISLDVEPLVAAFCDGLEEAGNIARGYLGVTPLPTLHRVENGKIMVSRWDANFNLTWVDDDGSYLAELKKPKEAE